MDRKRADQIIDNALPVDSLEKIAKKYFQIKEKSKEIQDIPKEIKAIHYKMGLNFKERCLVVTKTWHMDKLIKEFGHDVSDNTYMVKKWKKGCMAIVTEDSKTVKKMFNGVMEAVINIERLRIPNIEKGAKEYILRSNREYMNKPIDKRIGNEELLMFSEGTRELLKKESNPHKVIEGLLVKQEELMKIYDELKKDKLNTKNIFKKICEVDNDFRGLE